ncbi:hypothetical protein [Microcoleus vaginatus]
MVAVDFTKVGLGIVAECAWNVDRTEGQDYEKAFGRWRLKKQVGQ